MFFNIHFGERNLKIEGFLHVFYQENILCFYEAFNRQPSYLVVKAAKISTNPFFVFLFTVKLTLKL
jgi:hypothetical protein